MEPLAYLYLSEEYETPDRPAITTHASINPATGSNAVFLKALALPSGATLGIVGFLSLAWIAGGTTVARASERGIYHPEQPIVTEEACLTEPELCITEGAWPTEPETGSFYIDYAGGGYFYVFDNRESDDPVVLIQNNFHAYYPPDDAKESYRPVAPAASFCTILRHGDSGPDVQCLQEHLQQLGYFSGTATGFYGKHTVQAVKAFQRDCGLVVDGVAGPQTLAALERAIGSARGI